LPDIENNSPTSPPDHTPPAPPAPCLILGIDIGGTGAKVAALRDNTVIWTVKRGYRKPTAEDLIQAIRSAVAGREGEFSAVGLCVPGLLDERRERVALSVNVPALMDLRLDDLVAQALGRRPPELFILNDSIASGYDVFCTRKLSGRLLVLALGTGVGAAVLDDGVPLAVDNESPGHVGQFDVAVEGDRVVGPDGGAGSLEGYIGAAALRQRYGSDPASKMRPHDAPVRALAKAIRICHAIYRPRHIVLAGGLGIRLAGILPDLRKRIETDLTAIARRDWTLTTGDSDFHAACGAARWAKRNSNA
jgi:predicted NBD/HSP70 family sugar kinase